MLGSRPACISTCARSAVRSSCRGYRPTTPDAVWRNALQRFGSSSAAHRAAAAWPRRCRRGARCDHCQVDVLRLRWSAEYGVSTRISTPRAVAHGRVDVLVEDRRPRVRPLRKRPRRSPSRVPAMPSTHAHAAAERISFRVALGSSGSACPSGVERMRAAEKHGLGCGRRAEGCPEERRDVERGETLATTSSRPPGLRRSGEVTTTKAFAPSRRR